MTDLEAVKYEAHLLLNLCLDLPSLMEEAEAEGKTEFTVMIYGYEIVYQHFNAGTDDAEWIAFISDTAD